MKTVNITDLTADDLMRLIDEGERFYVRTSSKSNLLPDCVPNARRDAFWFNRLRQPANPYVEPLKNKKILVKIDLLEGLKEVWGESILIARDNIYKIVSGDVDDDTYHKLVCTYYRTHSSFANFIDYCYMSRSEEEPFIKKFVEETRAVIRNYGLLVEDLVMK